MDRINYGNPAFPINTDDRNRLNLAVLELARRSPEWTAQQIVAELARSERELSPVSVEAVQSILDARK